MDKINLVWVSLLDVIAFARDQVRVLSDIFGSPADVAKLANEIAKGWDPMVSFLTVKKITDKDDWKMELEHRQTYAKSLSDIAVDVDGVTCKVPSGLAYEDFAKIAKPKFKVVCGGDRRTFVLPYVAYARRMRNLDGDIKVPVQIVDWSDEQCYLGAIRENVCKTAGAKAMTVYDFVKVGTHLISTLGYNASQLTRACNKDPKKDRHFCAKLHGLSMMNLQSKGGVLALPSELLTKLPHNVAEALAKEGGVTPENLKDVIVKAIGDKDTSKTKSTPGKRLLEIADVEEAKKGKGCKTARLLRAIATGNEAVVLGVCAEID